MSSSRAAKKEVICKVCKACVWCAMVKLIKLFNKSIPKVEFLGLSSIVAIQTRGRDCCQQWIKIFRLELSPDCVTFSPLLDASGSNMVHYNFFFINLCQYIPSYWFYLVICHYSRLDFNVNLLELFCEIIRIRKRTSSKTNWTHIIKEKSTYYSSCSIFILLNKLNISLEQK